MFSFKITHTWKHTNKQREKALLNFSSLLLRVCARVQHNAPLLIERRCSPMRYLLLTVLINKTSYLGHIF